MLLINFLTVSPASAICLAKSWLAPLVIAAPSLNGSRKSSPTPAWYSMFIDLVTSLTEPMVCWKLSLASFSVLILPEVMALASSRILPLLDMRPLIDASLVSMPVVLSAKACANISPLAAYFCIWLTNKSAASFWPSSLNCWTLAPNRCWDKYFSWAASCSLRLMPVTLASASVFSKYCFICGTNLP